MILVMGRFFKQNGGEELIGAGRDGITLAPVSEKYQWRYKMAGSLSGMKVAILVTNGFEQSELTEPKKALEQAGAPPLIISPEGNQVRGWNHKQWGDSFPVDVAFNDARPGDYSALLLPGGVMNPD